ncbi:MAG: sulfate transporter CysZ [Woeseiaceae bacterium]
MISNPISGAKYFLSGLGLINTKGIRRFVLMPLLINIIIFSAGLWFAVNQFDIFITWALSSLPSWLSWLEWIMWPLFAFTFYGLTFFSFSIIANIIASPFNGPLAAAVEHNLKGRVDFKNDKSFMQEIKESIGNEVIKLKYSLYLMIPLIFLSTLSLAFPLISPFVAMLWMIYTVWVLAVEYAEFSMSNQGLLFKETKGKLAEKRILSLGFGSMVLFATMIPFVNFLVMPVAVAGATKMNLNEFQ